MEQKYGTKVLNSDASIPSDSEDESDEPPEVSEEMETQFLKTLALLKKKDPRIYNPGFRFFDEKEKESGTVPTCNVYYFIQYVAANTCADIMSPMYDSIFPIVHLQYNSMVRVQ